MGSYEQHSGAGKGCLSGSESGAGKGSESGRIELALLVLVFTTVILSDVLDSFAVFFFIFGYPL